MNDPMVRFYNRFDVLRNGCWQWNKSLVSSGYGQFTIGYTSFGAHRFSYILFKGDIPEGLHLDHLCRNRGCVNPEHLEAVTIRENLLRGETIAARNAAKTHCPQGHKYTSENTYIYKNSNNRPNRYCRRCVYGYIAKGRKAKKIITNNNEITDDVIRAADEFLLTNNNVGGDMGSSQDNTTPKVLGHEADNRNAGGAR